jgi:hypothetical protein
MVSIRSERGLTLVEILMASAISVTVLGASAALAGQMQGRYAIEMELSEARQEAGYALAMIERYLRAAGNNPFALLVTACPAAGTPVAALRLDPNGDGRDNDVRIQSDVSPTNGRIGGITGACGEASEDITIAHDADQSIITVQDQNLDAAPVARTDALISDLTFVYRDLNHNPTMTAASVAFVDVSITARTTAIGPQSRGRETVTLRSEVRLRNR